jgi:hypothetical protein
LATEGLSLVTGHPVHTGGVRGIKIYQNSFPTYLILWTKFGSNQRTLLLDHFAWFLQRQALKCKCNTMPSLVHPMRISTKHNSSVILMKKGWKSEIKSIWYAKEVPKNGTKSDEGYLEPYLTVHRITETTCKCRNYQKDYRNYPQNMFTTLCVS